MKRSVAPSASLRALQAGHAATGGAQALRQLGGLDRDAGGGVAAAREIVHP